MESKAFVGNLNKSQTSLSQVKVEIDEKAEENKQSSAVNPDQGNIDQEEVRAFLASINLKKYEEKFFDNGIEDMETVLELRDEHIEQLGVPLGHKLKIVKKIKDLR